MKLGMTSWSLPNCNLVEVAGIARVLQLDHIDVGFNHHSSLERLRVINDGDRYAGELSRLDIPISGLYHRFGESIKHQNLADRNYHNENLKNFEKAMRFCQCLGVSNVFVLPGIVNSGQTRSEAISIAIEALRPLVEIGLRWGVTVAIEAHVQSFIDSPSQALNLLSKVPGLKMALDYSHFSMLGYSQPEIDTLAPYAGMWHLRQARPGALQTRLEDGVLDFHAMFGKMIECGFLGPVSIEYVHTPYMGASSIDVITETIKMRELVRTWTAVRPVGL